MLGLAEGEHVNSPLASPDHQSKPPIQGQPNTAIDGMWNPIKKSFGHFLQQHGVYGKSQVRHIIPQHPEGWVFCLQLSYRGALPGSVRGMSLGSHMEVLLDTKLSGILAP